MSVPATATGHALPLVPPLLCPVCNTPGYANETCPLSVQCPRCQAAAGDVCRHPNGHAVVQPHQMRVTYARQIDARVRRAAP